MTIRREDLVAAASLGLLQYRQIDPLLVFLLQRDVLAKRRAMLLEVQRGRQDGAHALLSYLLSLLAIITVGLFGVLFMTRAIQSDGTGALVFFTALYTLAATLLSGWFKKRGYCRRIRLLSALAMTSVPLAVFALQQMTY